MSVESQELAEIRAMARDFAQSELRPHVERWDHERTADASLSGQLAELGFTGMSVPERFGGMELGTDAVIAILQEIACGEASVALALSQHARAAMLLLEHGTDAQRSAWLDRMASGDAVACIAVTEDEAGVDAGTAAAVARRTADGYALSGAKRWVTNGSAAAVAIVLAKVDGGEAGLFIVDLAADGIARDVREDTMGMRAVPIVTLELKDCVVGEDALIGGRAAAAEQLESTAAFDQLATAAIAVGIAEAAVEHARGYADVREQFNTRLRSFEGIQIILSNMAVRTAAAGALLRTAAASADPQQARMAKLFGSETAMEVTTQAVQVYGGYGYMRDYPVEKLMRDAKAMGILGGSDESLRVAVAEALYRD